MILSTPIFYSGPFKVISVLFIAAVAAAGYFFPPAGMAVPALMLLALGTNLWKKRVFCGKLCPNGRAYSAALSRVSLRRPLPEFLRTKEFRMALCGFMLFCVLNLTVRSGGGWEAVGRVFWGIYLLSVVLGTAMGLLFKPRSWCAVCPMGTLQDTLSRG